MADIANAAVHVLVVTGTNEDGVDEREFTVEHRGPVEDCATWELCPLPHPTDVDYDLEELPTPTFHGVTHAWIFEEGWCVRVEPRECFYTSGYATDRLPDVVVDLLMPSGPPEPLHAGRYEVKTWYDGDGEFDLTVERQVEW